MNLRIPYGRDFLEIQTREKIETISSRYVKPLENLEEAVKFRIEHPIGLRSLRSFAKRSEKACIIVPDKTRACPTKEILPLLTEELEKSNLREISILIGGGLHQTMSKEEITEMVGKELTEEYKTRARHSIMGNEQKNGSEVFVENC
jgi:nickel-dependent lactate racemase